MEKRELQEKREQSAPDLRSEWRLILRTLKKRESQYPFEEFEEDHRHWRRILQIRAFSHCRADGTKQLDAYLAEQGRRYPFTAFLQEWSGKREQLRENIAKFSDLEMVLGHMDEPDEAPKASSDHPETRLDPIALCLDELHALIEQGVDPNDRRIVSVLFDLDESLEDHKRRFPEERANVERTRREVKGILQQYREERGRK